MYNYVYLTGAIIIFPLVYFRLDQKGPEKPHGFSGISRRYINPPAPPFKEG